MDPTPDANQELHLRTFLHELGVQITSGVPMLMALRACEKLTRSSELRQAIAEMRSELGEGGELSPVIKRYPSLFSDEQQARFAEGEKTGNLDIVVVELAKGTDEDFGILVNKTLNRKPEAIVFLQTLSELLEPSDAGLDAPSDEGHSDVGWRPQQTLEELLHEACRERDDPANAWKFQGQEPEPEMSAQELASLVRRAGSGLSESGKEMVEQTAKAVETGSTLRAALERYPEQFDEVILNVVEAGEAGKVLGLLLKKIV